MRGICYSPVPVGDDPGYGEPRGDYFTSQYQDVFKRDIALMVEMGANTIRLYTFRRSRRHFEFLNMAQENNLIVSGAFEMGIASHSPINTTLEMSLVKLKLREQIRASYHPVLMIWMVGNEMNGGWQLYVCSDDYAMKTHAGHPIIVKYGGCMFRDDAITLGMKIDEL
jgi:hypothetical protein